MPGEAQQAAAVDRALLMKSRTFSEESDANRLGSETDSVLDNDTQVQIIRLRGQIERTRILINEQLRLRNMQPLEPGQTTLPAPSKRTSIISAITSAVGSAISTVTGVTSTPGTVNGSAPSSLSKEQEIKQLQEELNRTRKEITGIPQTPTLFTLPSAQKQEFPGVDKVIEYQHKKTENSDNASISSGKSNKSGFGLFRSKSTKSLKEGDIASSKTVKPVRERKKSIVSKSPWAA